MAIVSCPFNSIGITEKSIFLVCFSFLLRVFKRTRVSTSYEGTISDQGPNTGTRGFGDHHTNSTYFAWGRHPEQNNNCGFRQDSLGSSNGYLWLK